MIEILKTEGHDITFYCPECTAKYGAEVKTTVNFVRGTNGRWDKFWNKHQECGVAELDERIDGYVTRLFPEWEEMEERIKWVQEFEDIPYAAAQVRYVMYWRERWGRRPGLAEPPPPTNMDPEDIPEEILSATT